MRIQTLQKRIDVPEDIFKQPAPYFIYKRFKVAAGEPSKVFIQKIDDGYFFVVSNLIIRNPISFPGNGGNLFRDVKIDIRSIDRNRVFNNEPLMVSLISSPGCNSVTHAAPAPVDNDGFSVNFTAEGFKNCVNLNQIYIFSTSIYYTLYLDRILNADTYIDLLVRGYNVPENSINN